MTPARLRELELTSMNCIACEDTGVADPVLRTEWQSAARRIAAMTKQEPAEVWVNTLRSALLAHPDAVCDCVKETMPS